MRKVIVTTILFLFSACTMVLLFSACTMFRDSQRNTSVLTEQDAPKFIGSIQPLRGDAERHYGLGCYLQERKKHKPAIEEFRTAVEINPRNAKAYNAMGVSYDALGAHSRAVESYTAALAIDQKLDYVLNNLGYSYLLQDRLDLAIENFKKALDLDSDNERYRNNLGLAYAKRGQYDAAFAEFERSGDEARAHYNVAQLYYRKGRYREAEVHFAEASALKPSDPDSGRGLKAAGSLGEILAKDEKVLEKTGDTTVHTAEARVKEYNEGGFYAIPPEALEKTERPEIVLVADLIEKRDNPPIQRDINPVLPPALAAIKVREGAREEAVRILEEESLKLYDEAQALELLALQSEELENARGSRVRIEVSNGNGVNYMARTVGNFLKRNGVILMYLSNAPHFNHEETKIYYSRGHFREACQLAQKLVGRQSLEEVPTLRGGKAEIRILIGKDLVPFLALFRKA
jgi:Tfp pilus assembly protein PilF